jgi:autotransporter-associated beta strand protein
VRGCRSLSFVLSACAGVSLLAGSATAQSIYSGPPTATTAGFPADSNKWGNASNWSTASVPNATDATVEFLYGQLTQVEIDGNYTVGTINFTSDVTAGVALELLTKPTSFDPTKGLTLSTSSGQPVINVQYGPSSFFWYNTLSGTQGFEKKGLGRFTFRFNTTAQPFTGDVRISNGTVGINQDSSLGNAANQVYLGAVEAGATISKLFVEPGSNTGTINSARTINLIGPGAQIGVNPAAVTFNHTGTITESGGSFGFTKTDGGVLILAGTSNYTGTTTIAGGTLIPIGAANLPGFATPGKVNITGGTLLFRTGGATEWSLANVSSAIASTTGTGGTIGIDTTNATGDTTIVGATAGQGFGLNKIGANKLIITGANNYTGTTTLTGGTLQFASGASVAPASQLTIAATSGTPLLDLGGNSMTFATLNESASVVNKITNGSLSLNGNFQLDLIVNGGQGVDLSGLTNFTFTRADRGVRFFPNTINNTGTTPGALGIWTLASGTNTITANNVQIGGAAGTSQGNGHEGRALLGASNTFNIATPTAAGSQAVFQIGGFNGTGIVSFQTGLTNPTFKLRGGDGVASLQLLKIGETSSGVRSGGGALDLSAGVADIVADDIVLSRHIAVSANNESSSLLIGGGTVTANRLILGQKVNGGANPPSPTFNDPTLNSTVTLSGGTVTANTVLLGDAIVGTGAIPTPGATKYVINVNLNGGTLRAGAISNLTGTLVNAFSEAASARNFNFNGGTLTHLAGQDLTVAGTASTDADPATTGNFIFLRVPATNTGGILVDAGRKVTLADTVRIANSGGATPTAGLLRKSGAGGLQINGAIDPTVGLKVDAGVAQVSNGTVLARADVNSTLVVDYTGTSVLADVKANIVAGYNGGAWNGTTGYISSQAAVAGSPKQALGYAEASELYGPSGTTLAGLAIDNSAVVVMKTLAGDFNLDKTVNFDDLLKLAANYNASSTIWTTGDATYDGITNFDDLLQLAANYNQTLTGSFGGDWALAQSAVPEPTSLVAIGAAGAALLRRRRR